VKVLGSLSASSMRSRSRLQIGCGLKFVKSENVVPFKIPKLNIPRSI
jgi:hypothetical protein